MRLVSIFLLIGSLHNKREEKAMETMMEIFSIEVRKVRGGAGYGTSDCETVWSNVWVCTDGWNTWFEEAEDYKES